MLSFCDKGQRNLSIRHEQDLIKQFKADRFVTVVIDAALFAIRSRIILGQPQNLRNFSRHFAGEFLLQA